MPKPTRPTLPNMHVTTAAPPKPERGFSLTELPLHLNRS
jgi:hypothetical protein